MTIPELIRQLTEDDLRMLEQLCQPYEFDGSVTVRKGLLLSLLNEVRYHRGRRAKDGILEIASLVSMRDGKPYVTLNFASVEISLGAIEAIEHARRILHVAVGAQADAFLANFMKEKVGLDQAKLGHILQEFRNYREDVLGDKPIDDLENLKKPQ